MATQEAKNKMQKIVEDHGMRSTLESLVSVAQDMGFMYADTLLEDLRMTIKNYKFRENLYRKSK